MPFQPGQSGNPAGRPRGARNKATVLFEELLEGNGEAVIRKIIEQAKEGEGKALGWLMGILIPKRKGVPIEVDLPRLEGAEDAPPVIAAILAAVGAGDVTPDEGISLTRLVEAYLRAKEKVVKLAHRAGRERAVEAAAAKTREPKERNARPGEQAPVALYSVVQGDPPSQAGEPSRNSPAPELLHALLRGQTGTSLPRLRHEALSTTCPLARSAGSATRRASKDGGTRRGVVHPREQNASTSGGTVSHCSFCAAVCARDDVLLARTIGRRATVSHCKMRRA